MNRNAELRRKRLLQGNVRPAQIRGRKHFAGFRIDAAGRTDAHSPQRCGRKPGFGKQRTRNRSNVRDQSGGASCVRIGFCTLVCGDLKCWIDKADLEGRAAEINAETILQRETS